MDGGNGDCSICDYSYRNRVRDLILDAGKGRTSIYDLDLIVEVGSTIKTLIEYKRRKETYNYYFIPFFEYVALKKFARKFRVDPYIIIELVNRDTFLIWKVDRFEFGREYRVYSNGRKMAIFKASDALALDAQGFQERLLSIVYDQGERAGA